MSAKHLSLGIDLGTTNSAAAMFDGTQVHLVRTVLGATLTPSVVRIDAKGQITVGAKARRLVESDPENTRGEFKRLMGTSQPLTFPTGRTTRTPEALSAEVLKSLRADVKAQFGFEPATAAISVPALFELPQSAATSEAARLAGFSRVELIQEPIASALAAGWGHETHSGVWLVFDLGGGTFDASLLETRDGLLRVIGHDGDNFLGGRDFDWALVDHVLDVLAKETGRRFERQDPALAPGLRKIKLAVEDAKIELTRAPEAAVLLPNLEFGAARVDVDVTLTREVLIAKCTPLVDRAIAVCSRLLRAHSLAPEQLSRMVLVGGPTAMPLVRQRLDALLGVPIGEGVDPMTAVAHGAALYAATSGLDARPPKATEEKGARFWLQYPAITPDLAPHVVGKLVEEGDPKPVLVALVREDNWKSAEAPLSSEGAFTLSVDVLPRRPNTFTLQAKGADGKPVPVQPKALTIIQGLTINDPLLARSIGVALAYDTVRVYFERGAPLPTKRTFLHETVEALVKGDAGSSLTIPIVQGEYEKAHLCRKVGALELRGDALKATLPAGSTVELTLELDRSGRLAAQALVVATGQVFEQVAHLLVPDASVPALETGLAATRARLASMRVTAFRHRLAKHVADLAGLEQTLAEVEHDLLGAKGGDADLAQRARRSLLEADAAMEQLEAESEFPKFEEEASQALTAASVWTSRYGTPQDQRLLEEASAGLERARTARQALELQRRIRQVWNLADAAFFKNPDAWLIAFDGAASRVHEASDLPHAQKLVAEGKNARSTGDKASLQRVTQALLKLLPAEAQKRRLGYDSGVR